MQKTPNLNQPLSFITSTSAKGSSGGRMFDEIEVNTVHSDTFFDGISPLIYDSVLEPPLKVASPMAEKLNETFPTDEEKLESPEVDTEAPAGTPKTASVRRSVMKNGNKVEFSLDLPVVETVQVKVQSPSPSPSRRDEHYETAISEDIDKGLSVKLDTVPEEDSGRKERKKSRTRSHSLQTSQRKSQRVSLEDQPGSALHRNNEVAQYHFGILDAEIARLQGKVRHWTEYKNEKSPPEVAFGMIGTAIGQTELLLRKKFIKFRELINIFVAGQQNLVPDDLEGYWQTICIEIDDIDRRYAELDAWQSNEWENPRKSAQKTAKRVGRPKKIKGVASKGLKDLIGSMRAKNRVEPAPEGATALTPRSKRLQDTPRSQPKRRSTNCAGCTPQSHRRSTKNRSTFLVSLT